MTVNKVYADSLHVPHGRDSVCVSVPGCVLSRCVDGQTALGVGCDSVLQPRLWPSGLCMGGSASLAACVHVVGETESSLGLGV